MMGTSVMSEKEAPLLAVRAERGKIVDLGNTRGSEVIGCTILAPHPEQLAHVALRGLVFRQEGDVLVISGGK